MDFGCKFIIGAYNMSRSQNWPNVHPNMHINHMNRSMFLVFCFCFPSIFNKLISFPIGLRRFFDYSKTQKSKKIFAINNGILAQCEKIL